MKPRHLIPLSNFFCHLFVFLSFTACNFTVGGTQTGSQITTATLPLEAVLATVSGALGDFEGSTLIASPTNQSCLKSYNCNLGQMVTTFTSCMTPFKATFNGSTTLGFNPATSCILHAGGETMPDGTELSRSYSAFTRKDVDGTQASVTSTGFITATYLTGVGHMNITQIVRTYPASTSSGTQTMTLTTLSEPSINFQGSLLDADRSVTSGGVSLVSSATGTNYQVSMSALSWETPTCCYPSSGTISAILSGPTTGSQSLVFTSSVCGQASFTDVTGAQSIVTLKHGCE